VDAAKTTLGLGFLGILPELWQHTQKMVGPGGHNAYDWSNDSHSWKWITTVWLTQ